MLTHKCTHIHKLFLCHLLLLEYFPEASQAGIFPVMQSKYPQAFVWPGKPATFSYVLEHIKKKIAIIK